MSKKQGMFPEVVTSGFSDGATFDFYKPHADYSVGDFEPSLTRQEFADESDINNIMATYEHTGVMPWAVQPPHYADYTNHPTDLMDAMEIIHKGEAAFMSLPARVRREFDNDAMQFVEFASDPDNLDQMRQWGLAPPLPKEPPLAAPSPAPAAPGGASPAPAAAAPGSSGSSSSEGPKPS